VKYILDTNAVSALMRADPTATRRLMSVTRADVAIPQPVAAEIGYGLARLPRSKRRRALEERWAVFARELPRALWTDDVSMHFGQVKAGLEKRGRRVEDFDIAIAAHALAHGATLVTSDAAHMPRIPGLAIEDWSTK
jgi:tRNA(fMet)-specific endonuclease VapC